MNIRYPIYEGVYRILTVKGTDNQIANVKNAGQEIHHESNSKAGCKDKHQTIKI